MSLDKILLTQLSLDKPIAEFQSFVPAPIFSTTVYAGVPTFCRQRFAPVLMEDMMRVDRSLFVKEAGMIDSNVGNDDGIIDLDAESEEEFIDLSGEDELSTVCSMDSLPCPPPGLDKPRRYVRFVDETPSIYSTVPTDSSILLGQLSPLPATFELKLELEAATRKVLEFEAALGVAESCPVRSATDSPALPKPEHKRRIAKLEAALRFANGRSIVNLEMVHKIHAEYFRLVACL